MEIKQQCRKCKKCLEETEVKHCLDCMEIILKRSRGGKVKVQCQICGKDMIAEAWDLQNGNGKYCSRKCTGVAKVSRSSLRVVKCAFCQKDFMQDHKGAKFCNQECFFNFRRESHSVETECRWCHSKMNSIKSGVRQFCSHDCHTQFQRSTKPPRSKLLEIKCETCNNFFQVNKSNADQGRKYCSQECSDGARLIKNQKREEKKGRTKKGSFLNCTRCNSSFYAAPSRLKKRNKKSFCSPECFKQHVQDHRIQAVCEICNEVFVIPKSILNAPGGGRFCSKECRYHPSRKEATKKRNKESISYRILKSLRSRLVSAVKRNQGQKQGKTLDFLGCTVEEFKEYMKSLFTDEMSWDNWGYGSDKWNIDHIIPCSYFDLTKKDEQLKCFHYSNLQPMWQPENFSKGGINRVGNKNKINKNEF